MEGRVVKCFGGSGVLVGIFVSEGHRVGISFGAVGVDLVIVRRWDHQIHGMGWVPGGRDCDGVGWWRRKRWKGDDDGVSNGVKGWG